MIEKLNNTEGVAKSQTTAGRRELLREYRNKTNEIVDAVNDLEATVYGGDDHCDELCPDCWAETEPFIANLPNLSDEQMIAVHDRVADLLDQRLDDDDDGYCEQCDDYHDLPADDDEGVTEEVRKAVDDVRGKNAPRGSTKVPSGETYFVTKDDGMLFNLVKMCVTNPEIRLGQAICNVSGYSKAWLEDKDGELHDLWQWGKANKGPNKGGA